MCVLFKKQYSLLEKTLFSVQNPCNNVNINQAAKLPQKSFNNSILKNLLSPEQISKVNVINNINNEELYTSLYKLDDNDGSDIDFSTDDLINSFIL